jgi:hypothetical protein
MELSYIRVLSERRKFIQARSQLRMTAEYDANSAFVTGLGNLQAAAMSGGTLAGLSM